MIQTPLSSSHESLHTEPHTYITFVYQRSAQSIFEPKSGAAVPTGKHQYAIGNVSQDEFLLEQNLVA